MYVTNHQPTKGVFGDDEMGRMFNEMMEKLHSVSSPSTNKMFDTSVENYDLPMTASRGVSTRDKVISVVEVSHALVD